MRVNRVVTLVLSAVWGLLIQSELHAQGLSAKWIHTQAFHSYAKKDFIQPSQAPRILKHQPFSQDQLDAADRFGDGHKRVAMLLMVGDQIVYEKFREGATAYSRLISYSMAKSLAALTVGAAVCSGKIKSLDDQALVYVPDLNGTLYGQSSIKNLLKMSSGGSSQAHGEAYQGMTQDLRSGKTTVAKLHQTYGSSSANPQGAFKYNNLDTLALVRVVEAATKEPFSSFFAKAIAEPAGIQSQMAFGTDTDGVALSYGMAFATLQDWGRLGLYTLDAWHGKYGQCMMTYVREATDKQLTHQESREFDGYGYQFWTGMKGNNSQAFFMLGFGGQRVGVDPRTGGILVAFSYGPGSETIDYFRQWIQRLEPHRHFPE